MTNAARKGYEAAKRDAEERGVGFVGAMATYRALVTRAEWTGSSAAYEYPHGYRQFIIEHYGEARFKSAKIQTWTFSI